MSNGTRKQRPQSTGGDDHGSLLTRSAESLGRVFGTLQRQLNGATARITGMGDSPGGPSARGGSTPRRVAASGGAAKRHSAGARKATATIARRGNTKTAGAGRAGASAKGGGSRKGTSVSGRTRNTAGDAAARKGAKKR